VRLCGHTHTHTAVSLSGVGGCGRTNSGRTTAASSPSYNRYRDLGTTRPRGVGGGEEERKLDQNKKSHTAESYSKAGKRRIDGLSWGIRNRRFTICVQNPRSFAVHICRTEHPGGGQAIRSQDVLIYCTVLYLASVLFCLQLYPLAAFLL
jgi:hypothetical protein